MIPFTYPINNPYYTINSVLRPIIIKYTEYIVVGISEKYIIVNIKKFNK